MSQAPVLADGYGGEDRAFAEATAELNRRVDEGTSWSGNERNKLFLNLGGPSGDLKVPDFADLSSVAGFDLPDDARAIVLTRAVAFDGKCIRVKCEEKKDFGYELMQRFAQVIIDRLQKTRLQMLDVYGHSGA